MSLSHLHCGVCHARFCVKCEGTGIVGPAFSFGKCPACDGRGWQKDKTELTPESRVFPDVLCTECRKERDNAKHQTSSPPQPQG